MIRLALSIFHSLLKNKEIQKLALIFVMEKRLNLNKTHKKYLPWNSFFNESVG